MMSGIAKVLSPAAMVASAGPSALSPVATILKKTDGGDRVLRAAKKGGAVSAAKTLLQTKE